MKYIITILLSLSVCIGVAATPAIKTGEPAVKKSALAIKAVGDKTFINDLEFVFRKTTLEQLEKVLGKATRNKGRLMLYFDEAGITARLHPEGTVTEINIHFSHHGIFSDQKPKNLFSGTVLFKGVEISTDSAVADLLKKFKAKNLAEADAEYLPTTKLASSAWWFYKDFRNKNEKLGDRIITDRLTMITLWIR